MDDQKQAGGVKCAGPAQVKLICLRNRVSLCPAFLSSQIYTYMLINLVHLSLPKYVTIFIHMYLNVFTLSVLL